ncbi:nucleoside triphosphate pyrophosphatase [Salinisphaera sp. Q1T1-3]|uniref:Maf family protein n=1 Tax=Salinisphaera sp. Q1T1-3 TaxID=2321229 RepID=UPI000E73F9D9|nr:nucleoside triphosphate pyrophosphatase [Salinisphaera sp. Q1T1-3]RJS95367.1 septum formation protein Maf [Salinisphaera sp. Q1T1-3]
MSVSTPPVILASSSIWRARLLEQINVSFETISPDVDETPAPDESPDALALRLARDKAAKIAASRPEAIVIGSDQVAHVDGRLLGKPGTAARAREQLRMQSGQRVEFHTGLCVCAPAFDTPRTHLETVTTRFRTLDDAEIARYVAAEDVTATAGSLKSEGLGITLVEAIESRDPSALVGLPLIATRRLLVDAGLTLP